MSDVHTEFGTFTTTYDTYLDWAATEAKRFEWLFDGYRAKTGEDIVNGAIIDLMLRNYVQGRSDGIDSD